MGAVAETIISALAGPFVIGAVFWLLDRRRERVQQVVSLHERYTNHDITQLRASVWEFMSVAVDDMKSWDEMISDPRSGDLAQDVNSRRAEVNALAGLFHHLAIVLDEGRADRALANRLFALPWAGWAPIFRKFVSLREDTQDATTPPWAEMVPLLDSYLSAND